jgi:arsenite methyltransferase
MGESAQELREQVRERYAVAARTVTAASTGSGQVEAAGGPVAACCGSDASASAALELTEAFGSGLYAGEDVQGLPAEALAASLGCGNPMMVAALEPGERVLDLGSGGGIDVLLSARRVGPTGKAYGLDMTDEMLALAQENAAKAGATNVEFLRGQIEAIPLPAGSIDVVISNCVINLSTDKPAVLAEMFRVLSPGGRIGISDVVAEDDVSVQGRAERGTYVGCIAGALSRQEYLDGLAAAGFLEASVEFTHEAAPGMHGAIIRARKPGGVSRPPVELPLVESTSVVVSTPAAQACCGPAVAASCCEPEAKATCCSGEHPAGQCGCQ